MYDVRHAGAFTGEQREHALRELVDEVAAGGSVRLMCRCRPLLCHADGIRYEMLRRLHRRALAEGTAAVTA